MNVLLIDPSLFTAPYNAALSRGLRDNGVTPRWAVRGLRPGEDAYLQQDETIPLFYRWTDGRNRREGKLWKIVKGLEHGRDLLRLSHLAERGKFEVVHFQWAALPSVDRRAIASLRRRKPVILTVHDTTPFNGADVSAIQRSGFRRLLDEPHHLIVHTQSAHRNLIDQGIASDRISVIPHGPLGLKSAPRRAARQGNRWRVVMFGRLQSYKGLDVLLEALAKIDAHERDALEVIVAGEPMMPVAPLQERAAQLGLTPPCLQFRFQRHDEQQMADLLGSADCFVFPYRAIEASGVLYLVAGLGKWMIASALGAFVDVIGPGKGALVEPGNADMLARSIRDSIGKEPSGTVDPDITSWTAIGLSTRRVYERVLEASRHAGHGTASHSLSAGR
jgi:glycosyltransferase involved in cell wall biosynthesis